MKKLILLFVTFILLSSCAATHQYNKFAAKEENIPEGKARVYVLRTSALGSMVKFGVYQDSRENLIGKVGPKSYLSWDMEAGEHNILARAETERSVTINAIAGKTYYVKLIPTFGIAVARVKLELLSEIEGAELINELNKPNVDYIQ